MTRLSTRLSSRNSLNSAAPKSTSRRLSLTQAFPCLLQLRQLRGKIVKPPPVILDHCRWSSLYERMILQFCLNGSRFLTNLSNLGIQPLPLARLVGHCDREKKFAERSDRHWSAGWTLEFDVERYLLRI